MDERSASQEDVIPLHEETARIGKRRIETGRVRIKTVVKHRDELVEELLHGENVEIRRVTRNQPINRPPPVRQDGDTTIIPLVEEVVTIETRLILAEEIHVTKRTTTSRLSQSVRLRSQDVVVEREDSRTGSGASVSSSKE